MELTLQHDTENTEQTQQTRLFGVSDFQVNYTDIGRNTVTVFYGPGAAFDEVRFDARIRTGGEITQGLLNDILLNTVNKQNVVVLGGKNTVMLAETVAELPDEQTDNVTLISPDDSMSPDELDIPVADTNP